MRHKPVLATMAVVAAGLAIVGYSTSARSSDHFDPPAPQITGTPTLDIGDVYSWMADTSTLALVMTLYPNAPTTAKFDTNVQYTFHTFSYPNASALTTIGDPGVDVTVTFDQNQKLSLWLGNPATEYITGDASATSGLASADNKVKVFAGLRADPFFANFAGFLTVVADVEKAAAPDAGLTFNDAGCPLLPAGTSAALRTQLAHSADGGAPANFFASYNSLAIVVTVDKSLVAVKGPYVTVRGTTYITGASITDAGGQ